MQYIYDDAKAQYVAPFTGAWIEIQPTMAPALPPVAVAPFTGAWIEIMRGRSSRWALTRRTLHGCVD